MNLAFLVMIGFWQSNFCLLMNAVCFNMQITSVGLFNRLTNFENVTLVNPLCRLFISSEMVSQQNQAILQMNCSSKSQKVHFRPYKHF